MNDNRSCALRARVREWVPFLVLVFGGCLFYQHADPFAVGAVVDPAYPADGPLVFFDEGHKNFHTADGRYAPFVELLRADGYNLNVLREPFTPEGLAPARLLIIAGASEEPTEAEGKAVADWVRGGGALLLITDHPPYAAPTRDLAARFGIDFSEAKTSDPSQADPSSQRASWVSYQHAKGALAMHPILEGRRPEEQVRTVCSFLGQSIAAQEGTPLLKLSSEARDYGEGEDEEDPTKGRSAAGRAQAVALEVGAGRVVALGEAAMLTAQEGRILWKHERFGFNRPGNDNRQFALNTARWLTGAL